MPYAIRMLLIAAVVMVPRLSFAESLFPRVAEDTQHTDGEKGVRIFCRRTDSPTNSSGTTNDWQTLDCKSGGMSVYIVGTDIGTPSDDEDGTVASGKTGMSEVVSHDYHYDGTQWVRRFAPWAQFSDRVSGNADITDGSSTSVVAAQGAGLRFCATSILIGNTSGTTVTVDLRDGTGGSVLAGASKLIVPAGGGNTINLQTPICTSANTAMAADPSASASTVTVNLIGYKTKL